MGSWDETCGISTLPISRGDKVRYILLRKRLRPASEGTKDEQKRIYPRCYTAEQWCPVSLPIRARYEDEGEIRGYKFGYAEKLLMRELCLPETNASLKKLLEAVRMSTGFGDPVTYQNMGSYLLTYVMIHERIYNAMSRVRWLDYSPYDRISSGSTMRAAMRKYVADARKAASKAKTDEQRMMLSFRLNDLQSPITMSFSGESGLHGLHYLQMSIVRSILRSEPDFDESTPEVAAFLDDFATLLAVDRSMLHMRKFWWPQTGKGSQDDDMVGHRVLGRAIEKHIQTVRRKWHRENLGPAPWQRTKFVAD